jgi:hypothetical protein
MADPRAFISFDFDHNEGQKNYFMGQAKNSRTPFNIQDWSSKEELAQSRWQELIEERLKKCNLMIVLVGKSMLTAIGVHREIEMAVKNIVPFFGLYVDDANYLSTLPTGLNRIRVINWEWTAIADMIDKCMKEGKNIL